MANYIETHTEGKISDESNESELIVWLRDNNLTRAIPIFLNEDITLNELVSMGEDTSFLRQYLIDLEIPKSLSTRITFKISQILKGRDNEERKQENIIQQQPPKAIRVIVSVEEDAAINELKEHKNKLSTAIQDIITENNKVIEIENKIKSDVNAQFNKLMTMMVSKQEEILNELKSKSSKYKSELNSASQQLLQREEIVSNVIKSCENMIEENNMHRNERKQQILSTKNEILQQMSDDIKFNQYDTKFSFNHSSISPVNNTYCVRTF